MASGRTSTVNEVPAPEPRTDPFSFVFAEKTVDIDGHPFTFRELSVKENDACLDASRQQDGTFNGRTNMRMMIAKSSVTPKITVDDLSGLPNRVYLQLAEFVNAINSIDDALDAAESEDEDEGKS